MQVNEYDYQSLNALFGDYKERVQKLLNEEIDLKKLSEIAKKPIDTLTADDLAYGRAYSIWQQWSPAQGTAP